MKQVKIRIGTIKLKLSSCICFLCHHSFVSEIQSLPLFLLVHSNVHLGTHCNRLVPIPNSNTRYFIIEKMLEKEKVTQGLD